MFGNSPHDKYKSAYLRKQRLMAQRHRKYMRLRDIRNTQQSTLEAPVVDIRPNGFQRFITWLLKNIISFFYFCIDSVSLLKTQISIIYFNIVLFFKKSWLWLQAKTIETKKLTVHQVKKHHQEHMNIHKADLRHKKRIENETMYLQKKPSSTIKNRKKLTEKRKRWFSFKKFLIGILLLIFFVIAGFFVWFSTLEIPSVQNFENRKISNSTKIYDNTGEILLYDIHEDIRRTVVGFDAISPYARDAIVAIEDHSFYEHKGVVWKSTVRAVFQTVLSKLGLHSGGTAGGSTLTQQVIKNTLLNNDRVVSRKVKEWVLAYKIENKLSKDEILEIYLNEAPYGGTIYGIQEASTRFFGVSASELTIAQSAYLAAIPNLPTFYSPYGKNTQALKQRQRTILAEMKRYGFINDAQYRKALDEVVEFLPEEDHYAKSLHFVQYVREELEKTYGVDMVQNGGLQVVTTLDYELQQKAEDIIKDHIDNVEEEYDASNAGLIAIESGTGHIITMVGSRDYFDTENFDGNFNVTLAERQPGSSFKPIAYAAAFERGYLPESTIFDTETQFNSNCDAIDTTSKNGCYSPNNYDFDFKGPLTFRQALAQSRNIPAIKITHLAGLSRVIQKAKDLGISSLNQAADFYGLGVVLGGGEVSLLEMTSAYTVFANDGEYNKPTGILEVRDIEGNILEKYTPNENRVLDKNAARMVNQILSDNEARTPLFGSQSFLYFGDRAVAGKTGTTNDNRDAWLIGYTPHVAVGVWTGNNDNSPMKKGSSISGTPWRAYMDEVIENYPNDDFADYTLPDNFDSLPNMIRGDWYGGTIVYVDTVSGKLATEFTPEETKLAIPQPDPHTILHWVNKNDPTELDDSRNDSQYENWEYGVQQYVQTKLSAILNFNIELPTEYDDVHTANGTVGTFNFSINGIDEGIFYGVDEVINITFDNIDRDEEDIDLVQLFINNAFVGSDQQAPFSFEIIPRDLKYFEENNIVRVIMTDRNGMRSTQEISFTVNLD